MLKSSIKLMRRKVQELTFSEIHLLYILREHFSSTVHWDLVISTGCNFLYRKTIDEVAVIYDVYEYVAYEYGAFTSIRI